MDNNDSVGPLRPEWDRVPRDPDMTEFKRRARTRQAQWRASQGYEHGQYPPGTPNGSMLTDEVGITYANFLSPRIVASVKHRTAPENAQKWQTLGGARLRNNLLSSMPMCFNLFGELHDDPVRLSKAGEGIWGIKEPGDRVEFEWSPSRVDPEFTGDRTAFDVAVFFGDRATGQTVMGIETNYHEHAKPEKRPDEVTRMPRYRAITERALDRRSAARSYERALRSAGVDLPARFHLIRHSVASAMLADGAVSMRTASEILGHASTRLTADTYGHVQDSAKVAALDVVERALGG